MDITYAVEHAHDENILKHDLSPKKELYLSFMLSLLKLDSDEDVSPHCDEKTMRMRQQLRMYKASMEALDPNDIDYYDKKEMLIFKTFCEFRGLVHDTELLPNDQDGDFEVVERLLNE